MSSSSENIYSLAVRHILRPLVKAADPLSWIFFALFIGFAVYLSVQAYRGEWSQVHSEISALHWYGAWVLLIFATIGPIFTITRERKEAPLGILIGAGIFHLIVFFLVSVVVLVQEDRMGLVAALMAAVMGAVMIGIGWVVQHQSAARSSRRAHTFSILMQSRLSEVFQQHASDRALYYHVGVNVEPEDAPLATPSGYKKKLQDLDEACARDKGLTRPEEVQTVEERYKKDRELVKIKHKSLKGVLYLLNFYEFMSAGICKRELDEKLLCASAGGIVRSLYNETHHLRAYIKQSQPKAFSELDEVMKNYWS